MLLYENNGQTRLGAARRVFTLVPAVVFLLTLILSAASADPATLQFMQMFLRSLVASLASSFVCVAAYGFYRYLLQRSTGL